ncbi:unnamed protein product [Euphydryas editha]|uniref:Uncharacterized protein n=1 Tax=Euphydryas editha TaxID=104508 RepID=A0AAU9VDS5_EUPED|nr:unnamed protein product [Euphydryas editha]
MDNVDNANIVTSLNYLLNHMENRRMQRPNATDDNDQEFNPNLGSSEARPSSTHTRSRESRPPPRSVSISSKDEDPSEDARLGTAVLDDGSIYQL